MLWSCPVVTWMGSVNGEETEFSPDSDHLLSLLNPLSPHPPHSGPPVLWTLVPLLFFHPGLGGNNTTISGKKVQRRKCMGAGWRGSGFDLLRRHGYGVRFPLCSLPLHPPWPLISGVLAVQISRRRMWSPRSQPHQAPSHTVLRVWLASVNCVWEEMRSSLYWAVSRLLEPWRTGRENEYFIKGHKT